MCIRDRFIILFLYETISLSSTISPNFVMFPLILTSFFSINLSASLLEMFKFRARNLLILNYSSSGESKYSPILGKLSRDSRSVFSKNKFVVL